MITELTSEQEALIPVYRDKWRKVGFSIEEINRKKAAKSVNKIYTLNNLSEAKIIFLDSPCATQARKLV